MKLIGQVGLKDNKQKLFYKKYLIAVGFLSALLLISFGFELVQYLFIKSFINDFFSTEFYYLWFSVNIVEITNNILIALPISILPLIMCIGIIETTNLNFINKKVNELALLVFNLILLTYMLLKVILGAILPLVISDFTNDISVVLQYYTTSNSLKYLNVLFVVFVFIIYFNRLTIRLTKKVQEKKRGTSGKTNK